MVWQTYVDDNSRYKTIKNDDNYIYRREITQYHIYPLLSAIINLIILITV